ncbi:hypothetical protein ABFS83_02G140200 [Erythranthe nasuta]
MSCLFWNCRGLGGPLTIHEIGDMLRRFDPTLVFLSETKATSQLIDKLKRRWNCFGFAVDRVGQAGGLVMLWRKETNVDLLSYSQNHIDVEVSCLSTNFKWRCTGFYGQPDQSRRHLSWSLLRHLHTRSELPWIIGGDFNEVLCNSEKLGGNTRSPHFIEDFRSTLIDCGLSVIDFEGYPFTWSNKQEDPFTIRSRLDRVCANEYWSGLFPTARVHHLQYSGSDHTPILLIFEGAHTYIRRRTRRPFRFESMWIRREDCEEVVRRSWDKNMNTNPIEDLLSKTRECRAALIQWSKTTIRSPRVQIEKLEKKIHSLSTRSQTTDVKEEIRTLRAALEQLYGDNDAYWCQRSKVEWIKKVIETLAFSTQRLRLENGLTRLTS